VLNLLTSPRAARNLRGMLGTVSAAVRSVVAPSTLVEQLAAEAPAPAAEAPEPADAYGPDELPAVEDIEAAAAEYAAAADQARAADRVKRAAKKTIGRVPAGLYGGWLISRKASSRMTVDLEAVRATYARLGLGELPMKSSAPSLVVTRAEVEVDTAVLVAA
jgi:hypothetical protein